MQTSAEVTPSGENTGAAGGLARRIVTVVAVLFALFGIWSNSIGSLPSMKQSAVFLAFVLALIFMKYPTSPKRGVMWYDYLLAAAGAAVGIYTLLTTDRLALSMLRGTTTLDYFMAGVAILLVLEAARRTVGKWMALLPIAAILYALYGHLIPGKFGHFGFSLNRFLLRMYLVDEGIYGMTTQVAATYIFLFVLFGAFLAQSGAGQFFTELTVRLAGHARGGPAKVATISSTLVGSITGSAAANVATTGPFTIPLMKQVGFKAGFAGGVEAVASTGGLIMPPVMGAAAFIMTQYLGVSYGYIMAAALVPAILYYVSIYAWVHFTAVRDDLRGVPREEIPPLEDWPRKMLLFAPLIVIIWALMTGRTAIYAAFLGIIAVIAVSQLQRKRMSLKDIIHALEDGAFSALSACMAAIAAGIIAGVAGMTGIGQVLALNIVSFSMDNVYLALVLAAVVSLVLSLGLPATACYIITATIVAPALTRMGVVPIAAHMFVFYFAVLSNITPPVAIASFTAAGIANANPFDVAWQGVRIALPGFIIPFMFVVNPILLGRDALSLAGLWTIGTATLGVVFLAAAGAGYLFRRMPGWIRAGYAIASLLLIYPTVPTDVIAIAILVVTLVIDRAGAKAGAAAQHPASVG